MVYLYTNTAGDLIANSSGDLISGATAEDCCCDSDVSCDICDDSAAPAAYQITIPTVTLVAQPSGSTLATLTGGTYICDAFLAVGSPHNICTWRDPDSSTSYCSTAYEPYVTFETFFNGVNIVRKLRYGWATSSGMFIARAYLEQNVDLLPDFDCFDGFSPADFTTSSSYGATPSCSDPPGTTGHDINISGSWAISAL